MIDCRSIGMIIHILNFIIIIVGFLKKCIKFYHSDCCCLNVSFASLILISDLPCLLFLILDELFTSMFSLTYIFCILNKTCHHYLRFLYFHPIMNYIIVNLRFIKIANYELIVEKINDIGTCYGSNFLKTQFRLISL